MTEAWNHTRGSGATVGILDSGFSYDQGSNQYHPDGQLLNSSTGIKKVGFVDDFDSFGNCYNEAGQPYGNCLEWDDHGHGTSMAGLVGANDNNIGAVGVMPEGLTVSMKVAQNCIITGGCPDDRASYFIEDDDFYWAIQWASQNADIDVLSMSFATTGFSSEVHNALSDAYNQYDVLLLSASGNHNTPSDYDYPKALNAVIGVGGIDGSGASYGHEDYEDLSARSAGRTTFCSSSYADFCVPSGDIYFTGTDGGTSTSTAVTAGVAGLVRAHEPSLSAQQVRNRLISTARGPHNRVDALAALTNDKPLTVGMSGPKTITSTGTYTWTANTSGEDGSVSYLWEYKASGSSTWSQVGTRQSYSRTIYQYSTSNFRLRVTATSGDETASRTAYITVSIDNPYY